MGKSDHIALTLSSSTIVSITGADEQILQSTGFTRKSLRRTWNQLPRCQRNLIILGLISFCITLLLFLPGDLLIDEQNESQLNKSPNDSGYLPFSNSRQKHVHGARRYLDETDTIAEVSSLSAILMELGSNGDMLKDKDNVINALDNVVRSLEMPKSDSLQQVPAVLSDVNTANTQSINTDEVNDNNIEDPVPAATINTELHHIESLAEAIQNPKKVNGLSISEYLYNMQMPVPQKQHFHGATNARQAAVVEAFKHSWNGYKKYAWGHDNLKPITQTSHEWFGLGLTIVDALDTMYIMGLEDEFKEARDWVANSLKFDTNRDVNLFEVTIRVLGGLLAAYHLSGDKIFLERAIELGNRLLPSFQSPSGIPYSDVNLGDLSAHSPKWSPDSSTSEVTTIQLEFRDLSRSSGQPIYENVVKQVNDKVHALEKYHGLVPIFINANSGTFRNYATISLGARGDSYYEYLLKQWLQTGRKENDYFILDYMRAIDGVLTQLMRRTPKEQRVYIGELVNGKEFKPKMDHLTCFLPGTLLLGHYNGMPDSHHVLAKDLLDTCYETYMRQPTKLAPEITYFAVNENDEQDLYVKPNDAHNLLRPEFIESLYYFYALTADRKYQDMGWVIFEAFEKHVKVGAGYTSIGNVRNILNTRLRDMMESFWLSETLKYLYLLFSDNPKEIDLEKWVFNSEGHPLPIRQQ